MHVWICDAIVRYTKKARPKPDSNKIGDLKYNQNRNGGGGGRRMCFGEVAIAMSVRGRRLNGAQAHCSTHLACNETRPRSLGQWLLPRPNAQIYYLRVELNYFFRSSTCAEDWCGFTETNWIRNCSALWLTSTPICCCLNKVIISLWHSHDKAHAHTRTWVIYGLRAKSGVTHALHVSTERSTLLYYILAHSTEMTKSSRFDEFDTPSADSLIVAHTTAKFHCSAISLFWTVSNITTKIKLTEKGEKNSIVLGFVTKCIPSLT